MRGSYSRTRVRLFGFMFLAICACWVSGASPAHAQDPKPSCAPGDTYQAAGQLDEALKAYAEALQLEPGLPCAASLDSLVAKYLDQARALERAGLRDKATERLVRALEARPDTQLPDDLRSQLRGVRGAAVVKALTDAGREDAALKVLDQLLQDDPDASVPSAIAPGARAKRAFALAAGLDDVGLTAEAKAALKAGITADPTAKVPDELRHLGDPGRTAWWRQMQDWGEPIARSLAELTIAVLLLPAIALTLAGLGRNWIRRRLRVGEIKDAATAGEGALVGLLIRQSVGTGGAESGGVNLYAVGPGNEGVALPAEVTKTFPHLLLISALVTVATKVLPTRDLELTGALHPSGRRGVGLSLAMAQRGGRIVREITIWEDEWVPGPFPANRPWPIEALIQPAASWTLWAFLGEDFDQLGTLDWVSHASFAIGAA